MAANAGNQIDRFDPYSAQIRRRFGIEQPHEGLLHGECAEVVLGGNPLFT